MEAATAFAASSNAAVAVSKPGAAGPEGSLHSRGPLRVLTFTSLFPSAARPRHGIFVETRLRHLLQRHPIDSRVIAPVPWFPFTSSLFGGYAAHARTARQEVRIDGRVPVDYPRYAMLPRLGVARQPERMARAALDLLARWRKDGWTPQIIDAHYFYPDGVAAALIAEQLGLPFVVTARGTDINVIANLPKLGPRIRWAAARAAVVIAVADPLRDGVLELGIDPAKVVTLRNGVDLETFQRQDPAIARAQLGLPAGPLLGAVGNLVAVKDQALAIATLARLPHHRLVIVGDGPLEAELRALGQRLGVQDRLSFLPPMSQPQLAGFYSCLDALLVTSLREGWPNVVLESLACGAPVIASDVGAVREMLGCTGVGRVVQDRQPQSFAEAVKEINVCRLSAQALRQHAAQFDWASVACKLYALIYGACVSMEARE
jgi:teichuronic acid biosynthesis glycosyltransferase TuaC